MWPVILDEGSWVLWKKWQKKAKSALNEHKQTRQEWVKTCTSRSIPTQNSQVMVSPFYCVPLKTKSSSWNLKATKSPFSITAWCHLHLCIGVSAGERRDKRGATGSKFNWASLPTNGGGCLPLQSPLRLEITAVRCRQSGSTPKQYTDKYAQH